MRRSFARLRRAASELGNETGEAPAAAGDPAGEAALHRLIVESTSDLVFVLARDSDRCVYANSAAHRALDLDASMNPFLALHPDDLERSRDLVRVGQGEAQALSFRARDHLGRWRWLDVCASSVCHGEAPHVLVIGRDATERRAADERKAVHLEVSRLLADATTIVEATTRLLEVVCSHIGYEVGELWLCNDTSQLIQCVDQWHAPTLKAAELAAITRDMRIHSGAGLPGGVWLRGEPIWLEDLGCGSGFLRAPAAMSAGLHAAIGCPIIHHGALLGVLVFLSREQHEPDRELIDLLVAIGGQVAQFIARHRAERVVEEQLRLSLREKEMFIKELHHRVKNNLQLVISLLALQADQLAPHYPAVASAFEDTQSRIQTMALIHDTLCRHPGAHDVDLALHIKRICAQIYSSHGIEYERIALDLAIPDLHTELDVALPVGLIVNELVGNALKHGFPDGRRGTISVRMEVAADHFELVVRDDGAGLPPLLEPLTSGSLGLQLVRDLTEQLEGQLRVETSSGACFTLRVPLRSRGTEE